MCFCYFVLSFAAQVSAGREGTAEALSAVVLLPRPESLSRDRHAQTQARKTDLWTQLLFLFWSRKAGHYRVEGIRNQSRFDVAFNLMPNLMWTLCARECSCTHFSLLGPCAAACVRSCVICCQRLLHVCVVVCSLTTEPSAPAVALPKQRLGRLQQPASSSACRLPGAFSALRTGRKLPVLEQLPALFSPCWAPLILLDDWIEMTGEENRFDETFNYRLGCNECLVLRAVNVNCTCVNFRPKQGLVFILKIFISFYQH